MALRTLRLLCCRMVLATSLAVSFLTALASAVVVVGGNGNTTAASISTALGSDPGFANVGISSTGGASVTYLGYGWCLTANHVTLDNSLGHLAVNGRYYKYTQIVHTPFGSADLTLFQINGDPGLPSLNIGSSSPTASSTVVMIGNGMSTTGQQSWNVAVAAPTDTNWTWTSPASGGTVNPIPANTYWTNGSVPVGTYQTAGFTAGPPQAVRWGENQITQTNQLYSGTQYFTTTFNDPTYSPGPTIASFEAQGVGGDSGGAVFYRDQIAGWELVGMIFTVGSFPGQPDVRLNPVYGDITAIADLSQYRSAIQSVITPLNWTGIGMTWDTTSPNWANGAVVSIAGGTYYAATFGDTNPITGAKITNASITIQAAGVAPPSLVFNNNSVAYTFSNASGGTAGISGPAAIIKNGTGSVALLGSNSFTGPVYVNAGRINLQNSGALGTSSGVTVSSGAALELQNDVSIGSIPLTISGSGLAANPAGALDSVTGNNAFAGAITIGGGGATINSATAGATLTLSAPSGIATAGNPLTFSGPGNTTVTSAIWGAGSVTKSGSGTLTLSNTNSYTGGTTVTGGTLVTSALGDPSGAVVVSAAAGVSSSLVLGTNQNQTVGSLAGTVASSGAASVSIGAGDTLTINQATNTTFAGIVALGGGALVKSSGGTLEVDGGLSLGNNSSFNVNGGTLRLNVMSGSASVGSGAAANVSGSGTLELAGSVPALVFASNRANIINNSSATAGLLVSGKNQVVGNIDGSGSTQVNAGSDLTVNHIIQGSLVIGGTANSHGLVTVTASGEKTWGVDGDGNFSLGANWIGGVAPGGVGDSAAFTTVITTNRTVTLDADTTIGVLKFDSPNNYLIAGAHTLALQSAGTTAATINVLNIHGNGAQTISTPIALASDLNIVQNSSGPFTLSNVLSDTAGKQITVSGSGTTAITGSVNLGAATAWTLNSGTLRFNLTSGTATVGSGVRALVSGSASLELAGSVSALSSGSNRANIVNNSSAAAGVLVSGTNQTVGNIDGSGSTQVNAGSGLTANHIVQGALVIGGTAGSHGLVTIDASDASGNSLDQPSTPSNGLILAGSLAPSSSMVSDGLISASGSTSLAAGGPGSAFNHSVALGGVSLVGTSSVPEPSGLALAAMAAGIAVAGWKLRRFSR